MYRIYIFNIYYFFVCIYLLAFTNLFLLYIKKTVKLYENIQKVEKPELDRSEIVDEREKSKINRIIF